MRRLITNRLTNLLFFLVVSLSLSAQVSRLYTTKHGLKTNNSNRVDIDSRGFVWVSGTDMLGLFDGSQFHNLPALSKTGKPLFQTAYGVEEVGDGQFWVYTSQGLYSLDARHMQFSRISLSTSEDSIYGYSTNTIISYPKRDCKMATTNGFGAYVLNARTGKADATLSQRLTKAIGDNFAFCPMVDKEGRLWVSTKTTPLVCVNPKTLKRCHISFTPGATAVIDGSSVNQLLETKKGILVGTTHGLLLYDYREHQVRELNPPVAKDLFVSSMLQTRDGRILVGTDGRGIWEYREEGSTYTLTQMNEQAADFDMAFGKVMDMKEDQKGNIIAVFLQKGLVVIPPQSDCFHYHAISPNLHGKNATCITSIAIEKNGNYWVGTDGCGVFTTDGMRLGTAHPINEGLSSMLVQDVKVDKHGTVWVGTYGGGVQYLEGGRWTHSWLDSLRQDRVMTMFYDPSEDQLFVGTNGNGVFTIDIPNRTVHRLHFPIAYNLWISCILKDSQNTLWIATSSGIFYNNTAKDEHGELSLGGNRICNARAMKQDGNNILVATDQGLLIYNMKTHMQKLVSEGMHCPAIHAINTTKTRIWLATRTNIVSVDKKTYEVGNYSSFSGYDVGEFHRNSTVKAGADYILFGGNNGIICFTPELITNRPTKVAPVYFTDFATPFHTEEMDVNILYAKDIYLEHDNATFNIEFASVELGDPGRLHYEYMLEGLEDQWHTDVTTPHARYSSLPSGTYTLRVRAYMEDNPTEYTESTLLIHVAAPWYATIWAFIIYALLALLILWCIYQYVKQRREQREALRQSAEQSRMKEAKLNLFTSITHELRSPLMMIESPLKQLMSEDHSPERQSLYAVMHSNCDRLLGIVKQITDLRRINSGQLTLQLQEHNLVPYTDQVCQQFEGVAKVKNISFEVKHEQDEAPMLMDTTHFEKIITNLLSNAFKFTPQDGMVSLTTTTTPTHVEMRFYNNGPHFTEDDLQHLWERFYQGSAGSEATGSGIGLNLVYELVKLHHGHIEAHNVEPEGVEFLLRFPYWGGIEAGTPNNGTHATLLLVDDDTELVSYISSQLQKDYNIIVATSGNSAWQKVKQHRPDVVVTDYHMPDGNGVDLCQQIKSNQETAPTPIIMLTGEGDETLQLHSLNLQVDHYLEKPVNLPLLRSAIQQVLHVRHTLRTRLNRTETSSVLTMPTVENADEKLFSRINETIKKHLDQSEFSVQQLSDEVGISRVHLNRKMKERYGISPNLFIKSFRLKQAAYLLVHHKVNVSEVAYAVGFSTHSYFTTSFHDYFGLSPKEFIAFYSQEENQEALEKLLG